MKKILFVIFLLSNTHCSELNDKSDECDAWVSQHVFNTTERHYFNTTSLIVRFRELSEVEIVVCTQVHLETVELLKLYAERGILIDSDLDLTNLLFMVKFRSDHKLIQFLNVKGFNQVGHLHSKISNLHGYVVHFFNTKFDFYMDKRLIAQNSCLEMDFQHVNFFGAIRVLVLSENIQYIRPVCPYVFTNTALTQLGMFEITNSFLLKNQIKFVHVNCCDLHTNSLTLLKISVAYEAITFDLVNKHVFAHVRTLYLNGIITRIQTELFGHFKQVKFVQVSSDDFTNFYQNGLDWLCHLNEELSVDLTDVRDFRANAHRTITLELADSVSVFKASYAYPDEDFCLFMRFPHVQLVYPSIKLAERVHKCSCTLLWLVQYSGLYVNLNASSKIDTSIVKDKLDESIRECLTWKNFTARLDSCRFEARFNNCRLEAVRSPNKFTFTGSINNMFHFMWMEYVVRVVVQPILCILGILTNFMSILVVRNKRKVFQNVMYQHIFANSVFNLVYCVIFSFSLINVCIFPHGLFCSRLLKNGFSQYFTIYIIYFLGNAIRLCCNFSYIALSISRFYISTSNPSALFKRFESLNLIYFYSALIGFTVAFSTFKLFEFKRNESYSSFDKNFPFDAYGINSCEYNWYNIKSFAFKCKLFQALNLANNIFDNILFIIISIIIDILLIRFSNKLLKNKKILHNDNNNTHLAEALRYKETINKMIITNGTLYFVSHVPEFVITVALIVMEKKLAQYCLYFFSCTRWIDVAQSFNVLSLCLQFFIFLAFDKNFAKRLMHLIHHLGFRRERSRT